MPSSSEILTRIESKWKAVCTTTISSMCKQHAAETFYGAGFWNFYADYTVLGTPCFAMNTEAHLASDPYSDSNRWIPPNWRFDCISAATDQLDSLYGELSTSLEGQDDEAWEEVIEEHKQAVARVCHNVTTAANTQAGEFAGVKLPTPFVVGIFEEIQGDEEYDRLASLSVEASLIEKVGIPVE